MVKSIQIFGRQIKSIMHYNDFHTRIWCAVTMNCRIAFLSIFGKDKWMDVGSIYCFDWQVNEISELSFIWKNPNKSVLDGNSGSLSINDYLAFFGINPLLKQLVYLGAFAARSR